MSLITAISPQLAKPTLCYPSANVEGIIKNGLVALYKFNEGSGQRLNDFSGNGTHGQLGSTAGADTNDPTWGSQGLSFATDDYVKIADNPLLNLRDELTIETCFCHSVNQAGYRSIIEKSEADFTEYYVMGLNDNAFIWWDSVGSGFASDVVLSPLTWYCLSASFKKNDFLELSINNVVKKSKAVNYSLGDSSGKSLFFGCWKGSAQFVTGVTAYTTIYNRKLSLNERTQNYRYFKSQLAKRGVVLP